MDSSRGDLSRRSQHFLHRTCCAVAPATPCRSLSPSRSLATAASHLTTQTWTNGTTISGRHRKRSTIKERMPTVKTIGAIPSKGGVRLGTITVAESAIWWSTCWTCVRLTGSVSFRCFLTAKQPTFNSSNTAPLFQRRTTPIQAGSQ